MSKNSRARRADLIRSMEGLGPAIAARKNNVVQLRRPFWSRMPLRRRIALAITFGAGVAVVIAHAFYW